MDDTTSLGTYFDEYLAYIWGLLLISYNIRGIYGTVLESYT